MSWELAIKRALQTLRKQSEENKIEEQRKILSQIYPKEIVNELIDRKRV